MKVPIEIYVEIVERVQRDQSYAKTLTNAEGYDKGMQAIHEENARFLDEVLQTIKLEDLLSSSKDIADGVFIMIQHAISKPHFMKKMYERLQQGPNPNPVYLAYLDDRIRSFQRQPQRYGTQYDYDEQGRMSMYWTIDSIETINQRRSKVGLSSIQENERRFIHQPRLSLKDAIKYISKQHQWLIKTGWCNQEDIQRYERRNQ
jgi:hypothetical protein